MRFTQADVNTMARHGIRIEAGDFELGEPVASDMIARLEEARKERAIWLRATAVADRWRRQALISFGLLQVLLIVVFMIGVRLWCMDVSLF